MTAEEETKRYRIFVDNLKVIDDRNIMERRANGTALHGVTKFSDLSEQEFKHFLGVDITKPMKNENAIKVTLNKEAKSGLGMVDWSGGCNGGWPILYVMSVKGQEWSMSCQ